VPVMQSSDGCDGTAGRPNSGCLPGGPATARLPGPPSLPLPTAMRTPFTPLVLATLLAVAGAPALASDTASPDPLPKIVLVHGAFADGSSWNAVITRLQAAGYTVTAVQLPLTALADDVARTRAVLANQTGPTLLVGHSFGGAVITALGADAPNVVGLVFVAAFAPDEGETLHALASAEPHPPGLAAFRPDASGYVSLDPAGYLQYFAPDVDPAEARVMAATQKPIAGAYFVDDTPYGTPTWRLHPSWYLVAEDDQIIPPPAQHFFAGRAGATVQTIASSHVPMVSHPDVVAGLIMTAAQAVAAGD
jgi:pimeloyl-ACP methyl ester carboxylesterase